MRWSVNLRLRQLYSSTRSRAVDLRRTAVLIPPALRRPGALRAGPIIALVPPLRKLGAQFIRRRRARRVGHDTEAVFSTTGYAGTRLVHDSHARGTARWD